MTREERERDQKVALEKRVAELEARLRQRADEAARLRQRPDDASTEDVSAGRGPASGAPQ